MQIHLIDQVYQVGVVWQGRVCFVRLCTFPFSLLDGGWQTWKKLQAVQAALVDILLEITLL